MLKINRLSTIIRHIVQMIITETMIDNECADWPGLGRLQAYRRIADRETLKRTSRAELKRIGAAWRSNGDNSPVAVINL